MELKASFDSGLNNYTVYFTLSEDDYGQEFLIDHLPIKEARYRTVEDNEAILVDINLCEVHFTIDRTGYIYNLKDALNFDMKLAEVSQALEHVVEDIEYFTRVLNNEIIPMFITINKIEKTTAYNWDNYHIIATTQINNDYCVSTSLAYDTDEGKESLAESILMLLTDDFSFDVEVTKDQILELAYQIYQYDYSY